MEERLEKVSGPGVELNLIKLNVAETLINLSILYIKTLFLKCIENIKKKIQKM